MASSSLHTVVAPPSAVFNAAAARVSHQSISPLPSLSLPTHAQRASFAATLRPQNALCCFCNTSANTPPAGARLSGKLQTRLGKGLRFERLGSRSVRVKAGENEELPPELQKLNEEDDGKFAKISQGDPAYGPAALLLFGFTPDEKQDVQGLLEEIGGDFMKIVQATDDMLDGTLWDAFGRVQAQNPPNLAADVPRMCFISGLTGEELMMLVDAFGKSKMRRPVFAALVPKNKDKLLRELIDEVMGDHRKLVIEGRQRLREQKAKATG